MDELLTTDELAARLKVHPGTIRAWRKVGRIPFIRLSLNVVRFEFSAVVTAFKENQTKARRRGRARKQARSAGGERP